MKTIKKSNRPSSSTELLVVKLDGRKTKSLAKFYKKIARKLKFPDYFGRNLDALYDCLTDLSWCEPLDVILLIKNFEYFLCKEDEEVRNAVLDVLKDAKTDQMEEDRTFDTLKVQPNKV